MGERISSSSGQEPRWGWTQVKRTTFSAERCLGRVHPPSPTRASARMPASWTNSPHVYQPHCAIHPGDRSGHKVLPHGHAALEQGISRAPDAWPCSYHRTKEDDLHEGGIHASMPRSGSGHPTHDLPEPMHRQFQQRGHHVQTDRQIIAEDIGRNRLRPPSNGRHAMPPSYNPPLKPLNPALLPLRLAPLSERRNQSLRSNSET